MITNILQSLYGAVDMYMIGKYCVAESLAAVMSFIFAGRLNGIREGTVIAALLVGYIARSMGKRLKALPEKLFGKAQEDKTQAGVGEDHVLQTLKKSLEVLSIYANAHGNQ